MSTINHNPKSINDVVFGDEDSCSVMQDILNRKYPFPSDGLRGVCFYGVYGSGKTTYAKAFCEELEFALTGQELRESADVIECDKSARIDIMLAKVKTYVNLVSFNASGNHYIIFDEIDNCTENGQRALKTLMNNSNAVFILTTNYLHEVDEGIQNRCVLINFNATEPGHYLPRIKSILTANNLPLPSDVELIEIVNDCDGSWRQIMANVEYLANSLPPKKPPASTSILKLVS